MRVTTTYGKMLARVQRSLAGCAAIIIGLLAAGPGSAQTRDDIVVELNTDSFTFLSVDDAPQPVSLTRGFIELLAFDPECQASPDTPCTYVITSIRIDFSSFDQGDFHVANPFMAINGPIEAVDRGGGLVIPAGTEVRGGAVISLDDPPSGFENGYRRSSTPLPEPGMTLTIDVAEQEMTLRGEALLTFDTGDGTVTATGNIRATGNVPFVNVPPLADAGEDQHVLCTHEVVLDASASTDENLFEYFWYLDGAPLAKGVSPTVTLAEGDFEIELKAMDSFSSTDTDTVSILVEDPAPVFTFVPPAITTTDCRSVQLGQPTATSVCAPVTLTNDAPEIFPAGTTTVTWTATSSTGKTATATQQVTVILADDPACCPPGSNVRVGTRNVDLLEGTDGVDCILGLAGADTLRGFGGDDFLSGGSNEDVIEAGDGNDQVSAGQGQDQVFGGAGNDVIYGGEGEDQLICGPGDDTAFGEGRNDLLDGGEGNDVLDGGDKNDRCLDVSGTNTLTSCELTQ
jgi:hypothetical protein